MSTYIFDQGWAKERERLTGMEGLYDDYTRHCMASLGVSEGWQCLEVGFGAGSVALWLAEQVGNNGRVVATDLDPRFLDGHGRANLEVRKHDITADPLEEAAFDLVHARAILGHIPNRQRALKRMVSSVRPGGWMVVEDLDFGGMMAAAVAHYADPPEYAALHERVGRAFDASFGAQLIRAFKDTGLVNIAAEVHMPLVAGGTEKWAPGIAEFLGEMIVGKGLCTASEVESFLAMTADPSVHYGPSNMVTAWGQRPGMSTPYTPDHDVRPETA
jgi:SAM-dependent methyltransferase